MNLEDVEDDENLTYAKVAIITLWSTPVRFGVVVVPTYTMMHVSR